MYKQSCIGIEFCVNLCYSNVWSCVTYSDPRHAYPNYSGVLVVVPLLLNSAYSFIQQVVLLVGTFSARISFCVFLHFHEIDFKSQQVAPFIGYIGCV